MNNTIRKFETGKRILTAFHGDMVEAIKNKDGNIDENS